MKKILKNKKATAGLIMLIFFALLAIVGPIFVTDDPLSVGSVPLERMPLAHVSDAPGWYRSFLGNPDYTNNIYLANEANFNTAEGVGKWQNSSTSSGITFTWNPDEEVNYNLPPLSPDIKKGCLEINFTSAGNATLTLPFNYPYAIPPTEFGTEFFYAIQTQTQTIENGGLGNLTLYAYFVRESAGGNVTYPANLGLPLINTNTTFQLVPYYQICSLNSELVQHYGGPIQMLRSMFQIPGPYVLQFVIQFEGNATASGNPVVLLSNINSLLYGNTFGLLGSDDLGRDLFTQLVAGTRISFILGIVTAIMSVGIGLIVGLVAGYIGGGVDEVLMRINDMLLVIPTLPLMIVLVFVLGQSLINLILVIGLLGWMGFARTVRSAILSLKERSFIEAVRSSGGGKFYIIRKHLIPNVFPLVYITLAMSVPGAIVTEAALSFLGLGPQDVMSWGRILAEFEDSGQVATGAFTTWYWTIPPGVCIALLSLSFILIGFALDEILNPRLRER